MAGKGKALKKLCNYLTAACLLVCGCIFGFEAQARVCFAADENCGGKYKCACDTVKYPFWIIPPYNGSGMPDYRL